MIEKRFRVGDIKFRLTYRWSQPLRQTGWFAYIDGKPVNEEGFEAEETAYLALTGLRWESKIRRSDSGS
jgi:hypothetical protein